MSGPKNLVVAQSGGPSAVINNSLRGIIETARDLGQIGTVYGARHGIERDWAAITNELRRRLESLEPLERKIFGPQKTQS